MVGPEHIVARAACAGAVRRPLHNPFLFRASGCGYDAANYGGILGERSGTTSLRAAQYAAVEPVVLPTRGTESLHAALRFLARLRQVSDRQAPRLRFCERVRYWRTGLFTQS